MLSNVQVCYQNAWLLKRCYDKAAEGVQALLSELLSELSAEANEGGILIRTLLKCLMNNFSTQS